LPISQELEAESGCSKAGSFDKNYAKRDTVGPIPVGPDARERVRFIGNPDQVYAKMAGCM